MASNLSIDCYRCSWPFQQPELHYALSGACRILKHALLQRKHAGDRPRKLQLVFVGHSFGGDIALHAAILVAACAAKGALPRKLKKCLEGIEVQFSICTINGAVSKTTAQILKNAAELVPSLRRIRSLIVNGDADNVVSPRLSKGVLGALPSSDKRSLVLQGGSHDLFEFKDQLVGELFDFICIGHNTGGRL
jgi:pimeloyl-ACP methyl ester carboxylesterase